MITEYESRLIEYLSSFATENRMKRMHSVMEQRTDYITVVLEDIFQPHNASAVLRSCDGFGIQNVHIIENRNQFRPNKDVDMGTSQWLSLSRSTAEAGARVTKQTLNRLKEDGYRIVATTPHSDDTNLEDFDLTSGKTAIVLGTELEGISDDVTECADEYLKIPMHGFVESFNISVACALILHHLSWKLRQSELDWRLSSERQQEILLSWLRGTVNNSEALEKRFKQL
ncbi:MAG: RNA methyltransferase [Spirochaetales bacterium]|nr:RNA methyltransferase [Spirochaetales bacterium]